MLVRRAASTHQALLYADGLAAMLERTYDAARFVIFEAYAEPIDSGNGGTAVVPATAPATRASLAPALAQSLAAARVGSSTSAGADTADSAPDAPAAPAAPAAAAKDDDPDTLALESFKALVVAQDETNRSLSREAAELRLRVEAMETELRIARGAAGELEQLKRQLTAALDAHRQAEQSASDAQASAAAELAALREELSSRSVDLEAAVRESVECHDGRALMASDDL